ncbi:MAG: hypothetical protein JWQ71_3799 [Pedosphaera sp.]|nr:hypothetical protein [Pedosphaera sp.]
MTLSLVAVLGNDASQMQIRRFQFQPHFFVCFTASAGIRRFTDVRMQLSSARTPHPQVRLLRPFQQEDFVLFIETIKQSGDFIREGHGESEAGSVATGKFHEKS